METTKVGVVGVGHLGKLHTSLYKEVKDCEIVGIFDVDEKKKEAIANEHGVTAYPSYEALLNEVDSVNIVTPTVSHYELAGKALERGKHVFIEKPITSTEEQALELMELSEKNNRVLQVGHIERFNPAILALDDVTLKPLFIEAHRLASFNPRGTDVAVILDLMIHDLDLILHLVKSEPESIEASGVNVVSSSIDIANARIRFANGCVANITASRISAKKMRKMRLFQKNAYISMDFVQGFSEIFYIPAENHTPFHDGTLAFSLGQIAEGENAREIKYNRLERQNVNPLKKELSTFIESIRNDLKP
ncbi:MAG: gfo/Idh/MocA family oxidoreductase, partial [Caldithrix sp.]|nr:gfo/Idh/MocA family oxidoreductase [Caldithrix sp.]